MYNTKLPISRDMYAQHDTRGVVNYMHETWGHSQSGFLLEEWTNSSSDKEVMELKRLPKKMKLTISHVWDFVSEDQEG